MEKAKGLNTLFLYIGTNKPKLRKMLKKSKKLLEAFAANPWKPLLYSELKKHTGSKSESYTYSTLERFVKQGILEKEKKGNVSFYRIARSHKAISCLSMAAEHRAWAYNKKLAKIINRLLEQISSSFFSLLVVGSYAKGTQKPESDLDVIIIVPGDKKKAYSELSHYCEMSIPCIHLYAFSEDEFRQMLLSKEHNYGKEAVENCLVFFGAQSYYRILLEAGNYGLGY